MSESEVREIITPVRAAKIYRAFKAAWADYMADRVRYSRWPRTRANMVFERLAFHLQDQFSDDPGINFSFHDETVKLVIDQKLLARCKKANDRGLGVNVPTLANDLFCEQMSLVPDLDKIEIVYVVDKWATDIRKVLVQARDGDVKLWSYEIDDSALGSAAPVVPLRAPTVPPTAPADASDLVQPRVKPQRKSSEEDEKK
jgi:hypothetical protein